MPCVGFHCRTVFLMADFENATKERFLYQDNADEDYEREWSRRMMRRSDLPNRFDANANRGREQHEGDDGAGERLGLSVAERKFLIGLTGGDTKASPDNGGGEDIGRRFDRVRDEGIGISQDPGDELYDGQHGVDEKSELGRADAPSLCFAHRG